MAAGGSVVTLPLPPEVDGGAAEDGAGATDDDVSMEDDGASAGVAARKLLVTSRPPHMPELRFRSRRSIIFPK